MRDEFEMRRPDQRVACSDHAKTARKAHQPTITSQQPAHAQAKQRLTEVLRRSLTDVGLVVKQIAVAARLDVQLALVHALQTLFNTAHAPRKPKGSAVEQQRPAKWSDAFHLRGERVVRLLRAHTFRITNRSAHAARDATSEQRYDHTHDFLHEGGQLRVALLVLLQQLVLPDADHSKDQASQQLSDSVATGVDSGERTCAEPRKERWEQQLAMSDTTMDAPNDGLTLRPPCAAAAARAA